MEKENKKIRDAAKKRRNETVRVNRIFMTTILNSTLDCFYNFFYMIAIATSCICKEAR